MKKENKLLIKIKRLLVRIGAPRWLHQFGPKTYELRQHLAALILMEAYRLSLRRVEKTLELFGMKAPTYSALCKRRKKIPTWILKRVMVLTAGVEHKTVAIDATGLSRTNPSHHYLVRVYRAGYRKGYAKMSMLFGVDNRKIIAIHVRTKPAHDIRDVKHLVGNSCAMHCFLADKAYDAEWLHAWCYDRNVQTHIPSRKNTRKGLYRRKQMIHFSEEKYHQRSLIESGFSAIKRKYGGSVSGKSLASIRTELYCKALAYNMRLEQ
jgi:transposase